MNMKANIKNLVFYGIGAITIIATIYLLIRKNKKNNNDKDKQNQNQTQQNLNNLNNINNENVEYVADIEYLAPRSQNNQIIDPNITEVRFKTDEAKVKKNDRIILYGTEFDGEYKVVGIWGENNKAKTAYIKLKSGLDVKGKKYNNAKVFKIKKEGFNVSQFLNTLANMAQIGSTLANISKSGSNVSSSSDSENKSFLAENLFERENYETSFKL